MLKKWADPSGDRGDKPRANQSGGCAPETHSDSCWHASKMESDWSDTSSFATECPFEVE